MKKFNKIFRTRDIPEIDRYTIENEPVSSLDLMERAAVGWCDYFSKKFPDCPEVVIFAGNGNNGGDGYAIGRLLKFHGKRVVIIRADVAGRMSPDCIANRERYLAAGGEEVTWEKMVCSEKAVFVDAIFGSGLNRKIEGEVARLIQHINRAGQIKIAVDMPSGLMGEDNSGNDREAILRADYTFTFQFPKLAFMFAENEEYVGEWTVLDIGLHPGIMNFCFTPYYYLSKEMVQHVLPIPSKFSHKGQNGHGLLIAGSYGMLGAAILGTEAALNSGIGLITCHVPRSGYGILQQVIPEALVDTDPSETIFTFLDHMDKYKAIAVGPGLGRAPETAEAFKELLCNWKGLTILDADALNIISEAPDLSDLLHENCILTPHPKEFERLAGKSENDFERLNKLSTFATRHRVYVILKGAYTAVATPGGEIYFNTTGNPGMAKGGMGDVLTGVLLALAANGLNTLDVALAGVFAHGLSGDLTAEEWGWRGVTAGKVAKNMGKAWKKIENLPANPSLC